MNIVENVKLLGSGEYIPSKVRDIGLEGFYICILKAYGELLEYKKTKEREPTNAKCYLVSFMDIMYEYTESERTEFVGEKVNEDRNFKYYSDKEREEFLEELHEIWDENLSYSYHYIENDLLEIIYAGDLCAIKECYLYDDGDVYEVLNTPQVSVLDLEELEDETFLREQDVLDLGVYF